MQNYSIEERMVYGKPYISINLKNNALLDVVCDELSKLSCVHHVNISDGKRRHLTVYVQKFVEFKNALKEVREFMDNFRDSESLNNKIKDSVNTKSNNELFENISEDDVVVFISYAWDNQDHKQWVKKLADDLRTKYGIYTLIDSYLNAGANLVDFMTKGIKRAHKVLVIGSPHYKQKIDSGIPSGVVMEDQIINIETYKGINEKFIPILAIGDFDSSFSDLMSVNKGFDLSTPQKYNENIGELVNELKGVPKVPSLGHNSQKFVKESSSHIGLSEYLKRGLDPFKGEKYVKQLFESFSFDLMDDYFSRMPNAFRKEVIISLDLWSNIISSTLFTIKDVALKNLIIDFHNRWCEISMITGCYFFSSDNGVDYRWGGCEFDVFRSETEEKAYKKLEDLLPSFYTSYKSMADYLKNEYPNVDLGETSKVFESSLLKL